MVHPRPASVPAEPARGRRLGAVAAVLVLVAGACSGDDDSTDATTAPTTVPAVTTDTPPTTTMPPPPTVPETPVPESTVPETTEATTTTSASPTATLALDATTTTTVADPEVQAVIDAAHASWAAYIGAIRDPGDEERLLALAETKREEALTSSVGIVQDLIVMNQRAIPHPEIDAEFVPRPESIEIDGDSAVIEYCWVGSDIIVEVGASSDGTDRVVNDEVLIYVERENFEVIDGRWRKVSGTVLEQIEEEVSCDGIV